MLIQEQHLSLSEMRSDMKLEEASILAIAQQCVSDIIRSEHEAREKAIVLRIELQSELTVAELGIAGNAKLNIAFDRAENLAYQESQELSYEAAAAFQYEHAASSLDLQLQSSALRFRSPGIESNPTAHDAAHIARDVLAVLKPDQEQMMMEQQKIEDQIFRMMVTPRETLDSQRIAFTTEVRRMRTEIQESIRNSNPIEQPQTSWRANSPASSDLAES